MKENIRLIFDFDGTFTSVEALDELAEIVLKHEKNDDKKKEIISKIREITDQGMTGQLSFRESLEKRISLLDITRENIDELVLVLKTKISKSIKEHKTFFLENSHRITIISGGFKEFIVPVVKDFGIEEESVFANTFVFDENGIVLDFDKENPLSRSGGKVEVVESLNFDLKRMSVFMIGDGYTDFEVKKAGASTMFFAYTENFARDSVIAEADGELTHINALFYYV